LAIIFLPLGIPGRSAHADPLVPSNLNLNFLIVENGEPYLPMVKLTYLRTSDSTDHIYYSFYCAQNCYQVISGIFTGKFLGESYSLLVEFDGGKSFTLTNFNIYYTPRYDVPTNPTAYRVAVDIGWQSCMFTPKDDDKAFRIDGCSRELRNASDRATATAASALTTTAIPHATATAQAHTTETAAFPATSTAKRRATATAKAQGMETAAELTNEKALVTTPTPSITSTIQPVLVTTTNQAPSFTAIPGVQPTGTIAPPEERSTIGALWEDILPFLSSQYFVAIVMALLVESAVAFFLIRSIFKVADISSRRILLSCLFINIVTIPWAWIFMGFLQRITTLNYFVGILITETFVVIVESFWYRIVLPIRFRRALLLSFCANLASYLGGVILFGL
jgi:hypothetical protein